MLPKVIEQNKILTGKDVLKSFGEKYGLNRYETFILGDGGIDRIMNQNPKLGEHSLKGALYQGKIRRSTHSSV